ncbi:vitamin B12-dependent ribonucleotide reductase [Anaeromyxobacter sp. Fw109-5]|uniref:vitamin B12-dependent ribonucleotide reductase n=1 Tax=Anaeromyxobacter sp. (strain Fw109-5) TaxID=404589 RepID=UPI000158A443|nr:vitamin B12-dependent ribonucleotide reductase [Anaeromyxobacter sp. Fw109-5]ABS26400.1 ribonucleoside-diphosphate reductase, adenosylcobalamin-dependent [Anaeromyxobacter sp. Fw109-5]
MMEREITGQRARGAKARKVARRGLTIPRTFTTRGVDPAEELAWETRTAQINGEGGAVIFEQRDVEVPKSWSMLATNVVASKYFRGSLGSPTRERSVKQLVGRVVSTIAAWGRKDGYFATEEDAAAFEADLAHLVYRQKMSFNSPVWFNVGVEEHPQCSACFINSVGDSMDSILRLAHTEGMLFKYGSGAGSNLSKIRSSKERLSGGGEASGPVSFMRGFDAFAGVIKSGGKTRRAAKMVILDADHPDIGEFVSCKADEEKKAWALIDAGYDGGFNVKGGAYDSVFFQNANHSIRVTDGFMRSVLDDRAWELTARTDGHALESIRARDLMRQITEAAWLCGDPGMQFDTTINAWHTCPATDRINASNPCSEYMFLDDSACNLASLNLMHFRGIDGAFDVESFKRAVDLTVLAQEILVSNAKYPTEQIGKNSEDYRPLGLGYANLGALLMASGLPYDSDGGRACAGAITALMTGEAYAMSARIAERMGPFAGYERNREPFLGVVRKHANHVDRIDPTFVERPLLDAARDAWGDALRLGTQSGYRNAQLTVLAPTGTIGFMMDCDTTGIEPDIALVKYKKLVGGGVLKIVNNTVPLALQRLGYSADAIASTLEFIDKVETIEGAPELRDAHLPVFDCAFKPQNGTRSIHYMGHIRMMGAVQPFLSGAISKTVNMPTEATPADIETAYLEAWKLGLKAIAVYRDGCKRSQPLNTGKAKEEEKRESAGERLARRRLPDERRALTHKFSIGGHEGYMTVGMYDDGSPGEVFITMAKEGSVVSGLMDSFATSISMALQYGVPLKVLCDKFSHMRFEPSGFTGNPDIPIAKSISDYLFRWLALKFLPSEGAVAEAPQNALPPGSAPTGSSARAAQQTVEAKPLAASSNGHANGSSNGVQTAYKRESDAPPCPTCGSITVRNGACYKCVNCGSTTGCS